MDQITLKKLKMLVQEENWNSIEPFAELLIKKWNSIPVKEDTEFQTMWNVAYAQGKIDGVKEFINSIEEITLK